MDWRQRWAEEIADLAPTRERWRSAIRMLLALLTVTLIGQIAHLPEIYWAALTIGIICSVPERASIDKAIMRLGGTLLGVFLTIVCYATFDQAQPGLLLSMLLISAFGAYYWATSALYPYAFFLLAFTSALFTYVALVTPDQLPSMAWSRCQEISLGVLVGSVANIFVLPVSSGDLLRQRLADRLGHIARWIRHTTITGDPTGDPPDWLLLPRELRLASLLTDFSFARRESGSVRQHPAAWSTMVSTSEAMRVAAEQIARRHSPAGASGALELLSPEWGRLSGAVADELDAAAAALAAGNVKPPSTLSEALAEVNESIRHKRRTTHYQQFTIQELTSAAAALDGLRSLARRTGLFEQSQSTLHGSPERSALRQFSDRLGWSGSWPTVEWTRVVSAIKVSLAVLICVIFGSVIDWSLGTTMVATCAILATTESIGGLVIKARLRMVGAVAGGLVGLLLILALIPTMTTVGGLMIALAIGFAPFVYIAACGPSVSYLGLQGIMALAMTTLASNQPSIDLFPPSSRCLGIFLGATAFLLVQLTVMPVRAAVRLRQRVAAVMEQIANIAEAEPDTAAPTVGEQLAPLQGRLGTLLMQVATDVAELGAEETAGARYFDRAPADLAIAHCRLAATATSDLADARLRALRLLGERSVELPELHCAHEILQTAGRALRDLAGQWTGVSSAKFNEHMGRLRELAAQMRLGIGASKEQTMRDTWPPEAVSAYLGLSSRADVLLEELMALGSIATPEVLRYGPDQTALAVAGTPMAPTT